MTKAELKKISDKELIRETIRTYGSLLQNWTSQRGTKMLEKHWNDCSDEMMKRGILDKEDIDYLNM